MLLGLLDVLLLLLLLVHGLTGRAVIPVRLG
jgi:hypothetical protein